MGKPQFGRNQKKDQRRKPGGKPNGSGGKKGAKPEKTKHKALGGRLRDVERVLKREGLPSEVRREHDGKAHVTKHLIFSFFLS